MLPSTKAYNTNALQNPYKQNDAESDDSKIKNAVFLVPKKEEYKPIHRKAQVQEHYNKMKKVMREQP